MQIDTRQCEEQLQLQFSGEMTIYHVAEARNALISSLDDSHRLELDLSQVAEIDSAGMQLLMLLKRESAEQGKEMRITGHSQALVDLIQLYDLAEFFGDPLLLAATAPR